MEKTYEKHPTDLLGYCIINNGLEEDNMTKIWNKTIITINDEDFSVGDTINYLRWELEDD